MSPSFIASIRLFRFALPWARPVPPVWKPVRQGWLVRTIRADGGVGWGEASPLPGFSCETLEEAGFRLKALAGRIPGEEMDALGLPSVQFAWSSAVAEMVPRVGSVPVNGLIPGPADAWLAQARAAWGRGIRVLKFKVSREEANAEIRALSAVAVALPGCSFRLDANRGGSADEARRFADRVARLPVEYIEEPCRDLEGLPADFPIPVALDESWREHGDRILEGLQVPVAAVVVKPTLSGRAWPRLAVKVVVSSAFESGVGLGALARLAAIRTPEIPAGLDTAAWLADSGPLSFPEVRDGRIHLADLPTPESLNTRHPCLEEIPLG